MSEQGQSEGRQRLTNTISTAYTYSHNKQRTTADRQALERPTTTEQPKRQNEMSAIKFTTGDGKQMETTSSEDTEEIDNERILVEPIIHDTEGLDPQRISQGMKKEVQQMEDQSVFTEIDGNTMTPEQRANIIKSRWVLKPKHNEARARTVAKGYTEPVTDHDLLFASTPLFWMLKSTRTTTFLWVSHRQATPSRWLMVAGSISWS